MLLPLRCDRKGTPLQPATPSPPLSGVLAFPVQLVGWGQQAGSGNCAGLIVDGGAVHFNGTALVNGKFGQYGKASISATNKGTCPSSGRQGGRVATGQWTGMGDCLLTGTPH